MSSIQFPGSNQTRAALLSRLCRMQYSIGPRTPAAVYFHGLPDYYDNRNFMRQAETFPGATLGAMADSAATAETAADRAWRRWDLIKSHPSPARSLGEWAGALGAGAGLVNLMAAGWNPIGAGLLAVGGLGTLLLAGGPAWMSGHFLSRKLAAEDFQKSLTRWGRELSATAPSWPSQVHGQAESHERCAM